MKKSIILKIAPVVAVFLILTFVISGCTQAKPETIEVALDWVPNTNHTGMYVALEKGYYKDAGLEVKISQPPEGGALPLVSTNKAQFGISFQEEIATALTSTSPLDIVAVASIVEHNQSGLVSLKKTGIDSPKKLEGKVYATWDTPLEKAIISEIIKADGGDPNKLKYVANTATDAISALQTDIDVIWIFYGWDGIATEVKNLDTNYLDFRKLNPIFDYYTPVIISSQAYLNKSPETVKKFLSATAKGYEYAIANPEESAKILVKYAPEIDLELATRSQVYLSSQYKAEKAKWGTIDEARWSRFYNWLYEKQLIPTALGNKGFTNAYLPS